MWLPRVSRQFKFRGRLAIKIKLLRSRAQKGRGLGKTRDDKLSSMNCFLYRGFLIVVFLSTGSLTAWLFDESHILQGASDMSEARELLNKMHLEMAIAGGFSILLIDEIKKKIVKRQPKTKDVS